MTTFHDFAAVVLDERELDGIRGIERVSSNRPSEAFLSGYNAGRFAMNHVYDVNAAWSTYLEHGGLETGSASTEGEDALRKMARAALDMCNEKDETIAQLRASLNKGDTGRADRLWRALDDLACKAAPVALRMDVPAASLYDAVVIARRVLDKETAPCAGVSEGVVVGDLRREREEEEQRNANVRAADKASPVDMSALSPEDFAPLDEDQPASRTNDESRPDVRSSEFARHGGDADVILVNGVEYRRSGAPRTSEAQADDLRTCTGCGVREAIEEMLAQAVDDFGVCRICHGKDGGGKGHEDNCAWVDLDRARRSEAASLDHFTYMERRGLWPSSEDSPEPTRTGAEDDDHGLTNPSEACVAGQDPAPRGSPAPRSAEVPFKSLQDRDEDVDVWCIWDDELGGIVDAYQEESVAREYAAMHPRGAHATGPYRRVRERDQHGGDSGRAGGSHAGRTALPDDRCTDGPVPPDGGSVAGSPSRPRAGGSGDPGGKDDVVRVARAWCQDWALADQGPQFDSLVAAMVGRQALPDPGRVTPNASAAQPSDFTEDAKAWLRSHADDLHPVCESEDYVSCELLSTLAVDMCKAFTRRVATIGAADSSSVTASPCPTCSRARVFDDLGRCTICKTTVFLPVASPSKVCRHGLALGLCFEQPCFRDARATHPCMVCGQTGCDDPLLSGGREVGACRRPTIHPSAVRTTRPMRRLTMSNKPMAECSYAEQVASYLSGWGHLAAERVTTTHAAYIAQAAEWGMRPIQCAKNVDHMHRCGR